MSTRVRIVIYRYDITRIEVRVPRLPGSVRMWAGVAVVSLALIGCRGDESYVVPEEPMPANTILLSGMMRALSATPGFTDALLAQLNGNKQGTALMTPALIKRLSQPIL